MKYFIYEEGNMTHWYNDMAAWETAVKDFDFLGKFCDEYWSSDVDHCIAGIVPPEFVLDPDSDEYDQLYPFMTHRSAETDRVERPDENEIGEDGMDKEGRYWGECLYICHYHFVEASPRNIGSRPVGQIAHFRGKRFYGE